MNYAANVLLKPRRLILISHEFCFFLKNMKRPELASSKISRILTNSGCLLAGCCFSRQSDDETLLSSSKKNYGQKNVKLDDSKGNVSLLDSYTQVTNSSNIKRTSDCIGDSKPQNADPDNVISEPSGKRVKAVKDEKSTKELEIAQQKYSLYTNKLDFTTECANVVSQDDNYENTTSEPPCKRTKVDDKSIKEEISVKQELSVNDLPSTTAAAKQKERGWPRKQRPNYFVAVQISNDQIRKHVKEIQNHLVQEDEKLKHIMTDVNTLHITLMVMFIGDPETHARAKEALWNVHQDLDEEMSKNPLQLEFKGLSHFQNRVLYAKLSEDEKYPQLCAMVEKVKKHFAAVSIETTDAREIFTPHLTIAKIHFKDKHKGIKRINPFLYSAFSDQYFGIQNVESIQLLKMTGPKTENGYYSGDTYYFSAFDPSERIKYLSKSLTVEEKKKDVKDLINKLTKEKMK